MSRFHTVATVLIGTGIASATMLPGPASNGQHSAPVKGTGQATPAKAFDLSSALSNRPPAGYTPPADIIRSLRTKSNPGGSSLGTCPCSGSPAEGEANCGLPIDNVNGGCNSSPPVYSSIALGGSVCGTGAFDGSTRDTDWYQFTLATPMGVTWSATAEFDTVLFIVDPAACVVVAGPALSGPCGIATLATPVLPAGTYAAFIAPDFTGIFACGSGSNDYHATLTAGGCSSPANDNCGSATAISGSGPFLGTNACAGLDGPANCGALGADVWYNWTSGITGVVNLTTCHGGTSYDTVLSVYDGSSCFGPLLGCNDDISCAQAFRSGLTVPVVSGNVYKVQVGGYAGATGNFELTIDVPPPPPADDNCATPTAIAGAGPFAFDNTAATTGVQGQTESACLFYGSTTIDHDEWFTWVAPSTGQATLTVCGQSSVDTKIAIYPGAGCPSLAAIGCNDDACAFQSTVCCNVTNGQSYTIQLGTYPGATGGAGSFTINVAGGGGNPCQLDDGSSENMLGWGAGGDMAWIQRFGSGGTTNLNNVQLAFGSAAFPGLSPGNGSPATVLVYDDPNDDGIPNDLVLIQQIPTVVANVDTDMMNTIPVTPVNLNGIFFVGAGEVHPSGNYVAVMDQSSCILGDYTFFFGDNTGAPANYVNPSLSLFPPDSFAANGFACNLLVRAGCSTSPLTQFCFPGNGGVMGCPCGQPNNATGGCANFGSGATSGAVLNASGVASLSADSVVLLATNERPSPITNVFWTGKVPPVPGGVAHGAGVRCVIQNLKRLYTGQTVGGAISSPGMGDASVSARTAQVSGGTPILAGETRLYFNLYRDNQAAGPCGNTASTVNLTNAGSIIWGP